MKDNRKDLFWRDGNENEWMKSKPKWKKKNEYVKPTLATPLLIQVDFEDKKLKKKF